jgi:hypothetical protein
VVLETVTAYDSRSVMVQRFVPEIVDGDKRILLIDGDPMPYALARMPPAGETRANLAVGGKGRGVELSDRDRWICEQVRDDLQDRGLIFVGLDVIGDFLTEVNVTSPTCVRELDKIYGINISAKLMDCIAARYFLVATRKYPKKRSPGFRARKHLCRGCRDAQERPAAAHPAVALAHELDSGGPPKGHPYPCGGRTRSLSCPLRPRSSSALGARLDQGGEKQRQLHLTQGRRLLPCVARRKAPRKNTNANLAPLAPVQTGVGVVLHLVPLTQAEGGMKAKNTPAGAR